jgi:outer membrane protein W
MKKVLISLLLLSSVSYAELFQKGNIGLGVVIGSGSISTNTNVENYTLAGMNVDYFIVDDLSVGLAYLGWFGGEPSLNQVTIPVNYYIPLSEKFRPYIGVFLRETFVNDKNNYYKDYESYGAKIGLAYVLSKKAYLGFGVISEVYGSNNFYSNSGSTYPEITIAFSF